MPTYPMTPLPGIPPRRMVKTAGPRHYSCQRCLRRVPFTNRDLGLSGTDLLSRWSYEITSY